MNQLANNKKAGMTLLELIIYSAISSLMISFILLSAYPLINSADNNAESVIKKDELVFILRKLDWLFSSGVNNFEILEKQNAFRLKNQSQEFLLENKDGALYLNDQALSSNRLKIDNLSLVHSKSVGGELQYLRMSFLLDDEETVSKIFKLYLK